MSTGFQSELKSALDEPMREMRETAEAFKKAANFDFDGDGDIDAGRRRRDRAAAGRQPWRPTKPRPVGDEPLNRARPVRPTEPACEPPPTPERSANEPPLVRPPGPTFHSAAPQPRSSRRSRRPLPNEAVVETRASGQAGVTRRSDDAHRAPRRAALAHHPLAAGDRDRHHIVLAAVRTGAALPDQAVRQPVRRRGPDFCVADLQYLSPLEGFTTRLSISTYGGIILALPVHHVADLAVHRAGTARQGEEVRDPVRALLGAAVPARRVRRLLDARQGARVPDQLGRPRRQGQLPDQQVHQPGRVDDRRVRHHVRVPGAAGVPATRRRAHTADPDEAVALRHHEHLRDRRGHHPQRRPVLDDGAGDSDGRSST